jgi:hypothetical protein
MSASSANRAQKAHKRPIAGGWPRIAATVRGERAYVLTSMYQTTHRANANTITPAQYQPRSASSLIGSSSLFREGLYTHSAPRRARASEPVVGHIGDMGRTRAD